MCGAYGWISDTAVSAAKRASGAAPFVRRARLTSSLTAEIGVWNWKRRPMSSVTFAIVRCALRVSSPPLLCGAASRRPRARRATDGAGSARSHRSPPASTPCPDRQAPSTGCRGGRRPRRSSRPGPTAPPRSARLRHLLPAQLDPALVEEPRERLAEADHSHVVHRLDEEARVQQVSGRMVDPADVLVDRQPVVDQGAVERRLVVVGVGVAQVVPGRIDERVHRVRLPAPRLAAAGARDVHPLLVGRQGRLSLWAGSRRPPAAATGRSS